MAYENRSANQLRLHTLSLEDRKILTVTGVEQVDSFDDAEVVLRTADGSLIVRGSGLHMAKLDPESGEARMEGLISGISYEEIAPTGSLWARLFH